MALDLKTELENYLAPSTTTWSGYAYAPEIRVAALAALVELKKMEKMNEKLENSHIHSNKSKHTPCSGIDMHERTCRCPDCECIAYNQESNEGTKADEGTEGDESAEADKGTAIDYGVYQ